MEITKVTVNKTTGDGRLKGYATIEFDKCFVVENIRIIEGDEKMFVSMPNRKIAEGKYKDIAHPINQETRALIEDAIIKEYNNPTERE